MQTTKTQTSGTRAKNEYRWPSKVRRYELEEHPFLRLFVSLFESRIDWNSRPQGWCVDSLREYIRAKMLPCLEPVEPAKAAGTAFGETYYLQGIQLASALHGVLNERLSALKKLRETNPREAERQALEYFNSEKYDVFSDWWNSMKRHCADRPEWVYCLLQRVFANSDRSRKAPVLPFRAESVERLAAAVEAGRILPTQGLYSAYLMTDAEIDSTQSPYHQNGWTRISLQDSDRTPAEKIDMLCRFGSLGHWCVGKRYTAEEYLKHSDFYILCFANSPRVAIRVVGGGAGGPRHLIAEMVGVSNSRVSKSPWIDVMLYFLNPLKPTRKDAYRKHRTLSKLDSEAWMNLLDGFPFAERLAPEAVRRSQLFEERLQTAVLRYVNINRYWIEGLLHMKLVARKLNPLLGSKVSGILAEAEPLSFTTVPALLPFHEGLRKYGIEAAVSSIKGNKPPFGMSRGFLALPQVRATAVEAFDAEFSTQGATPLFHPFFSDEPGLFQKWEAAWKCFLITHCERLITDWRALQTRKASRKDVEESLGALEACLEFAGDEPHEFVCCSAAGRIKHRKVGRGLWFAAKRKSAARREGKSRFTGYPVGLWEEPEIQRTFLEGWLSYLRTFMLKCNGVSGYIGLEAEFFGIVQQIGLIFDSSEMLRRFVSECVGRAALSQLFPALANLSPDDEGCPHRRAVLAQFAADPELKSLWLRAGIAHLRHVGVPPFGVPRSFLALDEVLPVAVGLFKSGCCPFSKAAVFHPLFKDEAELFEEWRGAWGRYLTSNSEQIVADWFEMQAFSQSTTFLDRCLQVLDLCFAPVRDEEQAAAFGNPAQGIQAREVWCGWWFAAEKGGEKRFHRADLRLLQEICQLPQVQRAFLDVWIAQMQQVVGKNDATTGCSRVEHVFFLIVRQICVIFESEACLRTFVLEYVRSVFGVVHFPILQTLSPTEEKCPQRLELLDQLSPDAEFETAWLDSWRAAFLAHSRGVPQKGTWCAVSFPESLARTPGARPMIRDYFLLFWRRLQTGERAGDGGQGRASDDACLGGDGVCLPSDTSVPEVVRRAADWTAEAFVDCLALKKSTTGLEQPPQEIAHDPELVQRWAGLWPDAVATMLGSEAFSSAVGIPFETFFSPCGDGSAAEVGSPSAAQLVYRQMVLRFLSSRGPGRPLLTNDAIPKEFSTDAEVREAWVSAWARVVKAMPREYAVYRRVSISVQDCPRVFWAWLQSVRVLGCLYQEEEAWHTFLLLNEGGPMPPFLPRADILRRSTSLRLKVLKQLRNGSEVGASSWPVDGYTSGFVRAGNEASGTALVAGMLGGILSDVPAHLVPGEVTPACGVCVGEPAAVPLSGQVLSIVRESPWLIELMPARHVVSIHLDKAVLRGWQDYLEVEPRLVAYLPSRWRGHFQRKGSGSRKRAQAGCGGDLASPRI